MKLFKIIFLSLTLLFVSCSFGQGGSSAEEVPPLFSIKDISVDKPSVVGGELFKIRVYLVDDKIPLSSSIELRSPSEYQNNKGVRISIESDLATINQGFIEYEYTPSDFLESGDWILASIKIEFETGEIEHYDHKQYGHDLTYHTYTRERGSINTEIPNLYINITTTNQDTIFPELISYSIDKTAVTEGEKFTISIEAADIGPFKESVSGIKYVYTWFNATFENKQYNDYLNFSEFAETEPGSGIYQASGFFTNDQTKGIYMLRGISIKDNAFNSVTYISDYEDDSVEMYYSASTHSMFKTDFTAIYITYK